MEFDNTELLAKMSAAAKRGTLGMETHPDYVPKFRTPTGQTGMDAYIFELAQIENARRELDARILRLTEAIARELPEDAEGSMSIATDKFPDAAIPLDRDGIISQITFHPTADSFTIDHVRETLASIKS